MKTTTPTKKTLASSDSPATIVKCSSPAANNKKKKAAEEVTKEKEKKKQEKMEASNVTTDNNDSKKKTKKKKNDDEEIQMCSFRMQKVRRLVKRGEFDSNVDNIRPSQDAVFLISKASEMFLNRFTEDAFNKAASVIKDRSKKSPFLSYKHLSSIVSAGKPYEFLSDFVPEKVKAEDALKLWATANSQSLTSSTNALKTKDTN